MTIIAFPSDLPVPGEPDPEIVEVLEEYLEMAKRGEITGFAAAIISTNGTMRTGWQSRDWAAITAAVGTLFVRMQLAKTGD
ncbi:MAG: hypothetical protein C4555_05205 [Dehalococcoidia bacterium]|nr:MAG: hypothetical protein C4555_05205 [Dehalococcoidia bacterium]